MLTRLSLPAKVTALLSLVVFVVIFAVTYLINKISAEVIITDLKDSSRFAAEQIAKELADQPQLPALEDLKETLADALEINHSLTEISVFKTSDKGPELAATTSRSGEVPVSDEVSECLKTGKTVTTQIEEEERFWTVAAPIFHLSKKAKGPPPKLLGCVRLLTSLKQAETISERNRSVVLKFAPASILLLILLLNVLFRFTIHKPVKTIQAAMAKAEAGDLNSEVNLKSRDELGLISASYNRMLKQIREATAERIGLIDRINNFNVELKSQVEEATAELTKRNWELRELNEKLFKMQLELFHLERLAVAGQLTATFAHEVGTPLNLISGHVQLLMELFSDNDIILRKLTLVQSQINRLSEIVRRLLDATRRPKLDLEIVDLNQLIRDVSALIRPTLGTRQIECVELLQKALPEVQADRKQLEQVLLNLINNSIDAMPGGGKITLETCRDGHQRVAIQVTDTGTGIDTENLQRLFQPMFTTKDIGRGTGLGLSICKAIIKEHGGEIEVRTTVNEGTTFRILLPTHGSLLEGESANIEGAMVSES
jgi:two-component system, NtrC family, sensor kinase